MAKIDKIEVQERVTKVAMEMIMKYGLRGLNMVELAKECSLAKATLYKIIGTKEDLIRQIAFRIFEVNFIKMLEPFRLIDDPVKATKDFLDNYFDYAIQAQKILVQQIYKEYPLIEKEVDEKFKSETEFVTNRYREWQKNGEIRQDINVEYCIDALQHLNEFYVTEQYSEEETIARLRASFTCVLRGMGIEI
ncbi:TetR family transcriptional regulator [Marinifilum caeruleilacunae]|uniref:TetR family transcriptional regulator n=1 Tax=Marinifilum caeruleilacunae TaxID=2499076 RepID=UPI001492115E